MKRKSDAVEIGDRRRDLPIFIHSELDDFGLSLEAFRVYAHLARRAGRDNAAHPSYASIGEACFRKNYPKASPATLRRKAIAAVKELLDAGLILRESRTSDQGDPATNHYYLTARSEWGSVNAPPGVNAPGVVSTHQGSANTAGGVNAPKDTPIEDHPIEDTPLEGGGASPPAPTAPLPSEPPAEFVAALCWCCHGHQKPDELPDTVRIPLHATARQLHNDGYTMGDLRTWFDRSWRMDWRWKKDKQRPRPEEVRAGIPALREEEGGAVVVSYPSASPPSTNGHAPPVSPPHPLPLSPPHLDPWEVCLSEIIEQLPETKPWLADSMLVETGEMMDGLPLYRVVLVDAAHITQTKVRAGTLIRRTVSSVLRKQVLVLICSEEEETIP